MVEEFSRWTAESFGQWIFHFRRNVLTRHFVGAHPAGSEEENRNKGATPKVKLPMDEKGYPVLPSWEAIDRGGLMYKKMVIGKFMSEMYGE
jgi:hypothetical protein